MGVRELMNRHPRAVGVGTGLVVTAALAAAVYSAMEGPRAGVGAATQVFYSDDDGKSYFADDALKVSGFDHNGRAAVKAYVFSGGGKSFVGYLERLTPEAQAAMATLRQNAKKGPPDAKLQRAAADGTQIKRPGDSRWVGRNSAEAIAIISNLKGPGAGSDDLEPVLP